MKTVGAMLPAMVLAMLVSLTLAAGPAAAHAALLSSDPADGARVDSAPQRISLTFNQDVQPEFATVAVTGPDGTAFAAGDVSVAGPVASIALRTLGPAGSYTVAYRVVSADGHPINGGYTFELTRSAATQPPVTSAVETSAPEAGPPPPASRLPLWPFVVGITVLVAGLAFFAVRRNG